MLPLSADPDQAAFIECGVIQLDDIVIIIALHIIDGMWPPLYKHVRFIACAFRESKQSTMFD
jgi:hypothetical protein